MRQIYTNFITTESSAPQTMVVENGLITNIHEGTSHEKSALDLSRKCLIPGFIDSHCHLLAAGLNYQKLDLSHCSTQEEALEFVLDSYKGSDSDTWLIAKGYDPAKLDRENKLCKEILDQISRKTPILIEHKSGHSGTLNSAGLEYANLTSSTRSPQGGTYGKNSCGDLDGNLYETAYEKLLKLLPAPTLDQMTQAILTSGKKMARQGITSAAELIAGYYDIEKELWAYKSAIQQGCSLRIRLFVMWRDLVGPKAISQEKIAEIFDGINEDQLKIVGTKLFADGALSSRTAAIHGTYNQGGSGHIIYPQTVLTEKVIQAHKQGWPIAIHSIGDRATDLVINAYQEIGDASQCRIEHTMLLSNQQIEQIKKLGCMLNMQPGFLASYGESYKNVLPSEKLDNLCRFKSILEQDIPLAFSSDSPFGPENPWENIDATTKRAASLNQNECISAAQALEAYTKSGALANKDSKNLGQLKQGFKADFQVYDSNPLETNTAKLLQVYSNGKAIDWT